MIDILIFGYSKKYNQIKKAIVSCLRDLERHKIKYKLLVVFDGHKLKINQINQNKTVKKIEKYFKKKNIKIIQLNTNKGISYCRNLALEKLKLKFLFLMDGDDYIIGNKLSLSLKILKKNPLITGVFSNYYLNDKLVKFPHSKITNQELSNYISVPAPMSNIVYRTSNIGKTKFDEKMNFLEDFDFTLRIKNPLFVLCSKVLLKINHKIKYDRFNELKNRIQLIKKHRNFLKQDMSIDYLITSFLLTCYSCSLLKTFKVIFMLIFQTSALEKYLFLKRFIPIFIHDFYRKFLKNV
jgi:glycosyltransferase involved in cell wall biosynthesis